MTHYDSVYLHKYKIKCPGELPFSKLEQYSENDN